jgi:TRAP-type C4-dicarboxylate transport system substrate-binding protein
MTIRRFVSIAGAAALFGIQLCPSATAVELVYGSWPPAAEYLNRVALPKAFGDIDKATNGAIKWKLVPGGQLADPKATFQAIQDGLMHSGLGISTYVPNVVPSLNTIYSTVVFGDDIVAATGGALETLTLNCPSCIEEFKKINTVPLSGWTSSPYQLACREPIRTLADMKGKRIRATGGNVDLVQLGGGVPVSATLVETVGLLQRGGLDCQFGVHTWLKTFGYADFAKNVTDFPLGMSGPAVGLMINRDAWNKMTADQKQAHLKAAAWISATQALGQFVIENENIFNELKQTKGLNVIKAEAKGFTELTAKYDQAQRETNIANAKKFGVKDPGAIIDSYAKARAKWAGLSKGIGRDIDKFADAIWREIYSKADVGKL